MSIILGCDAIDCVFNKDFSCTKDEITISFTTECENYKDKEDMEDEDCE